MSSKKKISVVKLTLLVHPLKGLYNSLMSTIVFSCKEQNILIKRKPTSRAKRLSLRISARHNGFVLTIPPRTTDFHIRAFLDHCKPWIEKNLTKMFPVKHFIPGEEVTLHGTPFQCVLDPLRRKPILCSSTKTLRLPPRCSQTVLHELFKKVAMEHLTPYVTQASQALGKRVESVKFRDTKSRWGSCSAKKTISLSWRLILAPPDVARYVCIHEAVHLLHMNHSQVFWKTVEDLCPTYRDHKKWLKANGLSLMRI